MSSVLIQLSPSRETRLSFWVQMALAVFWLLYGGVLLITEKPTDDSNFFHILFLALAFVYLTYLLINYTPLFGVQAYLQITPGYLVLKPGLFQPKHPFPFEDMTNLHIAFRGLHLKLQDGTTHFVDLTQVKKPNDLALVKERVKEAGIIHGFPVSEGPFPN